MLGTGRQPAERPGHRDRRSESRYQSPRGHCAAITRSALGNVSPVPDPKRTAKPTNGIGKGSAKHGADGSRCYHQPRSYLTGRKTVHRLISFRSAGGVAGPGSILSIPDGDKRIAARSPEPAQRLVPLPVPGVRLLVTQQRPQRDAEVINLEAATGHEPVWRPGEGAGSGGGLAGYEGGGTSRGFN